MKNPNILLDFGRGNEEFSFENAYRGEQIFILEILDVMKSIGNCFLTGLSGIEVLNDIPILTFNSNFSPDILIVTDQHSYKNFNIRNKILVTWGIPDIDLQKEYDIILCLNSNTVTSITKTDSLFLPYYVKKYSTEKRDGSVFAFGTLKNAKSDDTRIFDIVKSFIDSDIKNNFIVVVREIEDPIRYEMLFSMVKGARNIQLYNKPSYPKFHSLLYQCEYIVWGRSDTTVTAAKSVVNDLKVLLVSENSDLKDDIYFSSALDYTNIGSEDLTHLIKNIDGLNFTTRERNKIIIKDMCNRSNIENIFYNVIRRL